MHQPPEIVKTAERVLVEMDIVVRGFARFHKYAVGSELRADARTVARLANRAWRDQQRRREYVGRLVLAVDDLKMSIQMAKTLQAFRSFAQFEALIRLVSDLGRQCGGWQRQILKGQNGQASETPARRTQILSARDASQGANP